MPDKRAESCRQGMWPGRDVAAYAKSVFSTQFSVTFTFLFSQHSRLLASKKRASHSILLPLYVEHCFRFELLEFCNHRRPFFGSWQRALRMTDDTDAANSSRLFFPFFACFLIFLKKAFSERKIALEKFPKKDEGTLQITVHDQ